jgi:WD40 repeat protein
VSHRKKVHCVAWNFTGTRLASGSVDTSVRVWTIDESGRGTDVELKGHTDSVDQLRWDPKNPDLLATASCDKTVQPLARALATIHTGMQPLASALAPAAAALPAILHTGR